MMKNKVESAVYTASEIQEFLQLGRTKTYDFLESVYEKQAPFRVLRIGRIFRIPKDDFDRWLAGGS